MFGDSIQGSSNWDSILFHHLVLFLNKQISIIFHDYFHHKCSTDWLNINIICTVAPYNPYYAPEEFTYQQEDPVLFDPVDPYVENQETFFGYVYVYFKDV